MDKKIEFVIRENLDLKLGIYISIFSKILMKWWTRGKEKKECAIYGKAGGESRTQFKNISSHASSCGMSRTPRFFLRDGIFSSFLLLFFPPPSLLPSFPFRYTNNICQSHLLRRANWNAKRDEKSCEWFPSNTCKKFLRFEEEDFTPLLRLVNFLLDELYFFFLSIFNFKQRRLE